MADICEPCKEKKRRGRKPISEVLMPDELSIEQERVKSEIEGVQSLRQVKHVPESQTARMNELRWDEGYTLKDISEQINVEFGDVWTIDTILYHTDPSRREYIMKYNRRRSMEGSDQGEKYLSEQAKEYAAAVQKLRYRLKAVGYSDEEIRALLELGEFKSRGRVKEAEDSILEMSENTLSIAKQVKEYGDPDLMNYRIADTNSISVNGAMDMKRQLEGAGMKDLADAIDLEKIKKIKKDNERDLKVGGWDRITEVD